ncbi:MAG TPA: aminotransferase class I/II-fold pyridoxal phosphate-dependent enzyme [Candidatus Saccharimonadales bacterium]|nr:aminotransferase class I/II-fold pyridoxal phosphate-dependent enzyme [Candidatus Saccharimonadales bacterium]
MQLLSETSKHAINVIRAEDAIVARLRKQGKKVISLGTGDPAVYFKTPKYIVDAYVKALREGKTSYSNVMGIPELREAVARRQNGLYGGHMAGEDVMVTQGVSEAITLINAALIDRGDTAVLFRPYYSPYLSYLRLYGGKVVTGNYIEERNWTADTDELERTLKKTQKEKKSKYLLIANPNNPTGTVLEEKVLREIVEIAKNHGMMLISDEIYDEIVYNGAKFTSISKLAKGIPHIILNGASKCYDSTGFRIGFLMVPEHDKVSAGVKARLTDLASLRLSPSTPSQYALVEGMNNTAQHKKSIESMRKEIARRVTFTANLINRSEYMSTVVPNGAFYIFPKLNMDRLRIRDDKEFIQKLLKEEQVQIARGSGFGMKDHIRIVALAPKEVLEDSVRRIERFCKRHSRQSGGIV